MDIPKTQDIAPGLEGPGVLTRRNYFIFGHNISHSLSPTLHNAGFQELGLPHRYSIHQSENVDETVKEIINRPDFGGASVTFPHKLQIAKLLDSVTLCAEKVGAVNTIIVQGDGCKRRLHGDNTDWVGIKRCIEKSKLENLNTASALVVGAGGAARAACYALQELGVSELAIVNRTTSNGEKMASHFSEMTTHVCRTFQDALTVIKAPLQVIVACVPADDLGEDKIPSVLFAGSERGVLVEMAYRPQITGMMRVAARYHGWSIYRGIDVLEEQAYEQFQMWTGREPPVSVMREAMQENVKANM
jgi:shikimate-5-dehydrogenase